MPTPVEGHETRAYKTGITRLYMATCSCGWSDSTGTYNSARRRADAHLVTAAARLIKASTR